MTTLTRIHQIEITTRCNLRCVYCPHPTMQREKVDMDMPTFVRTLEWVRYFRETPGGNQTELSLTGVGEGTLHPLFPDMLAMAREVLGWDATLLFATNGIALTDDLLRRIAPTQPDVYVSLHRPEKAGPAVERVRAHGLRAVTNDQFVTSAVDWGGAVDWYVSHQPMECQYLRRGWGTVMVDGGITRCCFDSTGDGVYASVWDEPAQLKVTPFSLCEPCSLTVPEEAKAKPEEEFLLKTVKLWEGLP